jgi:hypothetical protein
MNFVNCRIMGDYRICLAKLIVAAIHASLFGFPKNDEQSCCLMGDETVVTLYEDSGPARGVILTARRGYDKQESTTRMESCHLDSTHCDISSS